MTATNDQQPVKALGTALLRLFNSRHAEAAMSIQYQVAMTSSSNATVTRRVAGSSTTNS